MFEGSDLSLAYGSYEQDTNDIDFQQPQQQQQLQQQQKQLFQQVPQVPPPTQRMPPPPPPPPSIQPNVSYNQNPSEAIYASAYSQPQQQIRAPVYYNQSVSITDRFFSKWYDVLKVISFALIIVLAISIDRFFTFYLTQYVSESVLSTAQEVLVRLGYPIIIIIIIWIMKVM